MNRSSRTLSLVEARRMALAAQGFARPRPVSSPTGPDFMRTAKMLGLLQIDSVNVLIRSHYLPAFSRLGSYEHELLDRSAYSGRGRRLFEYWGHEASLIPVEMQPLFRWRMERARRGVGTWGGVARFGRERKEFCRAVLEEIRERGPLGISDFQADARRRGGWWGWSEGKVALEWLFWAGHVSTHSRRKFERIYDLTERVLPRSIAEAPTPDAEEAQRQLLRIAGRALGVATERDLRDYFRLPTTDARARIRELVEAGDLLPAAVEGWKQPAFLHPEARLPRSVDARALLSPFDSLIWERSRTERLFHFHFRLEIYTPAHKRRHGYYVLPFLLGERLVARVDLKADRARAALRVVQAHCESTAAPGEVAGPLREELRLLADWLGLERVVLSRRKGFTQLLR